MRPKFVIAVLLAATMLLGAIALVSRSARRPGPAADPPGAAPAQTAATAASRQTPDAQTRSVSLTADTHSSQISSERGSSNYIEQRVAQLAAYATNDDRESLSIILYEMNSPNETIRKAAEQAHDDYVERWTDKLSDLETRSDPQSLDTILSQLTSPDKEIRGDALEAAIQFDDPRNTIPRLQQIADETEDVREKTAILDAIAFLKLPSANPAKRPSR